MTVKPDEVGLAKHFTKFEPYNRDGRRVMDGVEDSWPGPPKRLWYILSKWADRGWVGYGTSIAWCWLEPDGVEPLRKIARSMDGYTLHRPMDLPADLSGERATLK